MKLETPRLILRDFVADDWRDVLAYQNDPRYLCFYDWTERTPEAVQAFIQMFLDQQQTQPRHKFQLAITLKDKNHVIGNCGIRQPTPDAPEAEIGYELDPNYWGHGYATEAMRAMLAWGWQNLPIQRVTAWCIAENTASIRVLEKLGLHGVERLPKHEHFKGRWWDGVRFENQKSKIRNQKQNQ